MAPVSSTALVDVIVVSYDTRDLLRACLRSIDTSGGLVGRVVVVDNASHDGSARMVAAEFPCVDVIALDTNLGFARANNVAFRRTSAPYVLLLNPDADLMPGTLQRLVDELRADPGVGVVGPVLVGSDGLVQFEGGRRDPSILGEFSNITHLNRRLPGTPLGRYMMNDWDHRSTRDVEVLSGACMLLRRDALAGSLFSEEFFMYGEDVELCQRLRASGWRVRYVGDVEVLHHGGAASKKARTKMRVAGVVSMAQLLRHRRGLGYSVAYLAVVAVAWPLGAVVGRVWPLPRS